MPFIRISLRRGRSVEEIRAIADAVHCALVRSFQVPAKDRFQVVHQHDAHEFFCDPEYMEMHRTSGQVLIQVFAGKRRNAEMKRAFYRDVCCTLVEKCGHSPDDVFVVVSSNTGEDWSFGKGLAQLIE
jgi:4-oxalocrotonate tautomerase